MLKVIQTNSSFDKKLGTDPLKFTGLSGVIIALVLIVSSCSDPTATVGTVPGKYFGDYGGGNEIIDIKADGTFTQEFLLKGEKPVENSGKWVVDGADVKFENFVEVFDAETRRLRRPPKNYGIVRCMWRANPDQLIFDFEAGYVAIKR